MTADRLLDTHCHLGSYPDPVAVMRAAESAEVGIVVTTESPDEYRRLRTRIGPRPHVDVALGLHPLRAHRFGPHDLSRFFRLVPETAWIGEVGLDYSRAGTATARQQRRVFDAVLQEAQPGRHPLTVHSRGAEEEVIRLLADAKLPAILHWYTGPMRAIDSALAAGLYFSFNVAMTRSKRFSGLVKAIPRERVLLETDGPYAKSAGQPAAPANLIDVIEVLSRHWNTTVSETTARIIANQRDYMANGRPRSE